MKKLIKTSFLLTAFLMCFNLSGCDSSEKRANLVSGIFEYHDISFQLADSYEYDVQNNCLMCNESDGSGLISLQMHDSENNISAKSVFDYQCESYEKICFGYAERSELNIDEIKITKITWQSDEQSHKTYVFILNNNVYTIDFLTDTSLCNSCSVYLEADTMINSLGFSKSQNNDNQEPVKEIPTKPATEKPTEKQTKEKTEVLTESDLIEKSTDVEHRTGDEIIGISDKSLKDDNIYILYEDSVRNDTTGKWRLAKTSDNIDISEYALSYYKEYFKNDDEVHAFINFTQKTTTSITCTSGLLFVTTYSYVEKEEHDASILFSGNAISSYIIYLDNGDIEKL